MGLALGQHQKLVVGIGEEPVALTLAGRQAGRIAGLAVTNHYCIAELRELCETGSLARGTWSQSRAKGG